MIDIFAHNLGLLDWWTVIHFGAGVILGLIFLRGSDEVKWGALLLVGALIAWEVLEILQGPGGFGGGETGANLLVDVIAGALGVFVVVLGGRRG